MKVAGSFDWKNVWLLSWRGVIISLLVGSNIVLIRIVEMLGHKNHLCNISKHAEINKQLNATNTLDGFLPENVRNSLRGSEHLSRVLTKMEEIKEQLCENNNAGCRLCPYGWLRHGENCYYYSNDTSAARTWNEGREECGKMGAHLLVILDLDQRKVIESWLKQRTSEGRFWIGLQRDGDGWRWVTGHRYDSSLVQISEGSSNSCAFLYSGTYYPEDCKVQRQWICQKDAVKIDLHTAEQ